MVSSTRVPARRRHGASRPPINGRQAVVPPGVAGGEGSCSDGARDHGMVDDWTRTGAIRRTGLRDCKRQNGRVAVADPERTCFAVDKDVVDRAEATVVCSAVLDLLRPRLDRVVIDAYSDYRDAQPDDVAEAERWLLAKGALNRPGDPGWAIELDPADAEHWANLRRYAPWSINVNLCADPDPRPIATLHDCGYSVTAYLTPNEAANLAEAVVVVAPVLPLALLHARRRAQKAELRAVRRAKRRLRFANLLRRR